MEDVIYIHYGSKVFNPYKGFPVKNSAYPWVKPSCHTGLWASRENATFGWKQWCEQECFADCMKENSFRFRLRKDAKVAHLHCKDDILKLPLIEGIRDDGIFDNIYIDFEQCVRYGYAGIELEWYGDEWKNVSKDNLYYNLYGWDCDSIVILNSKYVEVL